MSWDADAIAAALNATSSPRLDPASGAGVELTLRATQAARLELYEEAGHIRLSAGRMQVSLYGQEHPPRLRDGELVVEQGAAHPAIALGTHSVRIAGRPSGLTRGGSLFEARALRSPSP